MTRFHVISSPFLSATLHQASLAKFLLAVRWEYPVQVDQAVELLQQWPVVSPEYVLELLNRHFVHPCVRRFAVARLQAATDEVRSNVYHIYRRKNNMTNKLVSCHLDLCQCITFHVINESRVKLRLTVTNVGINFRMCLCL